MENKKKSKKWLIIAIVAIAFLIIVRKLSPSQPELTEENEIEEIALPKTSSANPNDALAEVRKEKKVKEAILTEANILYVSVVDDGTRRDGYAEYLCGILRDHSLKNIRVKIVKVGSTNSPKRDNAYGVLLGESRCL